MSGGRSHTPSGMEDCLEEALSVLKSVAAEMEAARVAVIVVENSGSIRIVYQWPDSGSNGGQVEDPAFLKERMAAAEAVRLAIPSQISATVPLAALATWLSFEVRRLRRDLTVVSGRLGQRKTVERAKGLLQAQHGWSEPEAYEHLRKLSRQQRKPMAEIAQAILRSG